MVLSALDTRDEVRRLHGGVRPCSQPATPLARIKSRMGDDVQRLLQQRRYDDALEALMARYEQKVFRMAVAMLRDAGSSRRSRAGRVREGLARLSHLRWPGRGLHVAVCDCPQHLSQRRSIGVVSQDRDPGGGSRAGGPGVRTQRRRVGSIPVAAAGPAAAGGDAVLLRGPKHRRGRCGRSALPRARSRASCIGPAVRWRI